MAYFMFTKSILEGKPIKVFNRGDLYRDFTYIDDITEGVVKVIEHSPITTEIPRDKNGDTTPPYKIYNIGNSTPVRLLDFIETIEKELGKKAVKNFHEMQPGDVYKTYADVSDLQKDYGYSPNTPLAEGIKKFVSWYMDYYKKQAGL